MLNASTVRPEDLRAELARKRILHYRLAAVIGVNPGRLSSVLNENTPLAPALAERIVSALNEDEASL